MLELVSVTKKALKRNKINAARLPKYEEFALKKLKSQLVADEELMAYFSTKPFEKSRLDMRYIVTVIASLRPGFVEKSV